MLVDDDVQWTTTVVSCWPINARLVSGAATAPPVPPAAFTAPATARVPRVAPAPAFVPRVLRGTTAPCVPLVFGERIALRATPVPVTAPATAVGRLPGRVPAFARRGLMERAATSAHRATTVPRAPHARRCVARMVRATTACPTTELVLAIWVGRAALATLATATWPGPLRWTTAYWDRVWTRAPRAW